MQPNICLFDFDGTLVDSMPVYEKTMKRLLDENSIPYGPDLIRITTPLGLTATTAYFQSLGLKLSPQEQLEIMKEEMVEQYFYHIPEKPNVTKTLKELKSQGLRLCVLTASPHVTLDPCLKRLGIFGLFDEVWSCDDFSTTKSDPSIYIRAAEKLGMAAERILFLDDNPRACRTAASAGMKVCAVYDASSEEFQEEMRSGFDAYIADFSELPNVIAQMK